MNHTADVLAAAAPSGMKAQQLGYQPEGILAGRRINHSMGPFIAQKLVKLLIDADVTVKGAPPSPETGGGAGWGLRFTPPLPPPA